MNLIKLPKKGIQLFWDFWGAHHKLCVPWFGNGAHEEHMTFMCKNFKLIKK
jgi:hypothetical protein